MITEQYRALTNKATNADDNRITEHFVEEQEKITAKTVSGEERMLQAKVPEEMLADLKAITGQQGRKLKEVIAEMLLKYIDQNLDAYKTPFVYMYPLPTTHIVSATDRIQVSDVKLVQLGDQGALERIQPQFVGLRACDVSFEVRRIQT